MQEGGAHIDRPPPRMGEHTEEVLAELGYDRAAIEALWHDDVIGEACCLNSMQAALYRASRDTLPHVDSDD